MSGCTLEGCHCRVFVMGVLWRPEGVEFLQLQAEVEREEEEDEEEKMDTFNSQ